jgi:hypothetical protein
MELAVFKGVNMKKTFVILLAVLIIGIVGFVLVAINSRTPDMRYVRERPPAVLKQIEKEIAQLENHPWAGRYLYGDGYWVESLVLAPKNGFVAGQSHCKGALYRHGTVDWDGNIVKLSFKTKPIHNDYPTEYKPIRWGERVYLIPANNIVHFCNAINAHYEPRKYSTDFFSGLFLRDGDEKKEVEGKPELPEEFFAYLLDEPVDATVLSVGNIREHDKNNKIAIAVLNKGTKDGLLPGMKLYVTEPEHYQGVEITKVEDEQCEGEFLIWYRIDVPVLPAVGWQLSTFPNWRRNKEETE